MDALSLIVSFEKFENTLPFYQLFGLVCALSAPIKICCYQFSPAPFFQRAYFLVEHTLKCLRFRRFFSCFTVVLRYLRLFMMSDCKSSYQIIVMILKNYQVNYEMRVKRVCHKFLSQIPLLFSTMKLTLMDSIVNCGQVR